MRVHDPAPAGHDSTPVGRPPHPAAPTLHAVVGREGGSWCAAVRMQEVGRTRAPLSGTYPSQRSLCGRNMHVFRARPSTTTTTLSSWMPAGARSVVEGPDRRKPASHVSAGASPGLACCQKPPALGNPSLVGGGGRPPPSSVGAILRSSLSRRRRPGRTTGVFTWCCGSGGYASPRAAPATPHGRTGKRAPGAPPMTVIQGDRVTGKAGRVGVHRALHTLRCAP